MDFFIKNYVKFTDMVCVKVGRITMYLVFAMMFILILSFVTRNIITDDHVRMDLFYSKFSEKNKARMDAFTSIFLFFYLVTLLYGSISSLNYTIETNQRLFTAWRPYVWPIKSLMTFGILLMLLQTLSMFFKDLYRIRGKKI